MQKFLFIFLIISFLNEANASNKVQIIEELEKTLNLTFDFEQNTNGKIEFGYCTIQYPKKIIL